MSKIAVITGGTKGLGADISRHLAAQNWSVAAIYRKDSASAQKLRAPLIRDFQYDISQETEYAELLKWLEPQGPSQLLLIHNASSFFEPKPLHLSNWQDFQSLFDTNLRGPFQLTKALLPQLKQSKNFRVIAVLSRSLSLHSKGFLPYVCAKAALQAFTRSLVSEYSALGLRAFTVSPGYMETALTGAWNEHWRRQLGQEPSDTSAVAKKIVDLALSESTPSQGEDYALF